jgi:hypothetical protein
MRTIIALGVAFALLCSGISIAAADDGGWVTCKDGMKMHGGGACESHGGVQIPVTKSTPTVKSTPIDTTKGLTPNKTATTTKPKAQKTAASNTTQKHAASKKTHDPTAKCMDGAMYFSTEHRGACAAHGGVNKWY